METDVVNNIRNVLRNLPEDIQLVAVSKFHSKESIEKAYSAGQRVFGESHEQELKLKKTALPQDICWHFIGHLQTNKVKYIAPYIDMIEAVDSFKLMKEINKQYTFNTSLINSLQDLDGYAPPIFYDFGDYVRNLCTDETLRNKFQAQLSRTVPYKSNTEYYYSSL